MEQPSLDAKEDIKITAIVPTYNAADFLARSIRSLINQTEAFFEIIIIDDGSTDNSSAIIEEFMAAHAHIRLIKHEKNQGVCRSLNDGLKLATGDYVLMGAADDWYHHNIVTLAKKIITAYPSVGLICGDAQVNRYDKSKSFNRTLPYSQKNTFISANAFKNLAQKKFVAFNSGGSMLINRKAILEAGLLQPQLRWHCDWLLYYVIAFKHGVYYKDQVFVYLNLRAGSYSEKKHQWKQQKPVLIATIESLYGRYPDLWNDFKENALLPHYALHYIPAFIFNNQLRRFLTKRLLWKLFVHNSMVVRIGRIFPYRIILGMRKLLRA